MRQLSRQNIDRQIIIRLFIYRLKQKKKGLARFERKTCSVPGVFVISSQARRSRKEIWIYYQLNLNLPFLFLTILNNDIYGGKF